MIFLMNQIFIAESVNIVAILKNLKYIARRLVAQFKTKVAAIMLKKEKMVNKKCIFKV